jgi:hypothetical protein
VIAPRLADYVGHLKQAAEDVSVFVEGLSKRDFMAEPPGIRSSPIVILSAVAPDARNAQSSGSWLL